MGFFDFFKALGKPKTHVANPTSKEELDTTPQLGPGHIRLLSKVEGKRVDDPGLPAYFSYSYEYDTGKAIGELIDSGYLSIGTIRQNVEFADMQTLRRLCKGKGLKAGGKKVDLIERVLQNYTDEELKESDVPDRYAATEEGKRILKKNAALLFYFNSLGSTGLLSENRIIQAQHDNPEMSDKDIIICLLEEKKEHTDEPGAKRAITAHLRDLYSLDDKYKDLIPQAEEEIRQLDKLWEEEREKQLEHISKLLGIPSDEIERIEAEAREELKDDTWEKELDAKNRAKAGIEE